MNRNVLIVGSRGQDGRILTELMKAAGDMVTGLHRDNSDITSRKFVDEQIKAAQFDEIYFLAAVQASSREAHSLSLDQLLAVNFQSPLFFMEAIREHSSQTRFLYANSAHVFGRSDGSLLKDSSPMNPICNYGFSKKLALESIRYYRTRGIYASNAILFNHDSSFKKPGYLSTDIIRSAQKCLTDVNHRIEVSNPDQLIDWGSARNFVEALPLSLRNPVADDFVIATGELHSVKEFIEIVLEYYELDETIVTTGKNKPSGADRGILRGSPDKISERTSWRPRLDFRNWVREMLSESQDQIPGRNANGKD